MSEADRLRTALEQIRALVNTDCDDEDAITAMLHAIDALACAALAPPQPTPDTRPALTPRQSEVLACIRESIASRGYAPSVREIGVACGLSASTNAVVCHLRPLVHKGYLRRDPLTARSLVPVEVG